MTTLLSWNCHFYTCFKSKLNSYRHNVAYNVSLDPAAGLD